MIVVIGLHGARGSGKDTIAGHLVTHHGFEALSLAGPMRAGLLAMFEALGLEPSHFEDRALKELACPALNGRSPRHALMTIGTEWGRQYMGEDVWLKVLHAAIRSLAEAGADRFVIPDVRMGNEAEYLRTHLGARIWGVIRPGSHFLHNHGSEFALPDRHLDRWIANDGTLQDLARRVDDIVERTLPCSM